MTMPIGLPGFDALETRRRRVRLYSIAVRGEREAELRANAALLATIEAVREFGRLVVKASGGPAGRVRAFTEVPFHMPGDPRSEAPRPDGLIRTVRGFKDSVAIVGRKVEHSSLREEQVQQYHPLACDAGASALISISTDR